MLIFKCFDKAHGSRKRSAFLFLIKLCKVNKVMAFDCYYLALHWIFNNFINKAIKQTSLGFFIVCNCRARDVTLYVQILIKLTTVTAAKLLQSQFTLVN